MTTKIINEGKQRMSKRNFYIKESEMDDYQRKIISKRSDDSLVVEGCAGSGKSIIALWKLHDVVSNNKGTAQLIVLTKALKEYFVEGCRKIDLDPNLIDYWYHWSQSPTHKDYLFVDEAQDFTLSQIEEFRNHSEKLLLYGDSSQQLYRFLHGEKCVTMKNLEEFINCKAEHLVFNHRLPKRIARLAQIANRENDDLEERCTEEGPENPYILHYDSFEDQLITIMNVIQNRELEDVGIFLPTNEMVKQTADFFRSKGMRIEYKTNRGSGIEAVDTLNFGTSNPKIMTYHSAKGLQFESVFLPECDSVRGDFEGAFYVAMTRSYRYLYIMYTQCLPDILASIPSDLYSSTLERETELL